MKILNLYAGIGGNRKLWGNEHQITADEISKEAFLAAGGTIEDYHQWWDKRNKVKVTGC